MRRNVLTKCLFDSGNFFSDLISENLARELNIKIDTSFQKTVGTAQAQAKCEVIGRAGKLHIHIENIPGTFEISPFVVRDLSHEMNLGQSFLRRVQAELMFRNGFVNLKIKGGVTSLTSRHERIDRPSIDHRLVIILDRYAEAGRNPAVFHKETMRVKPNRLSTSNSILECNNKPKKAYNSSRQVIKAKHTCRTKLNCSDDRRTLYDDVYVLLDPNRHDETRNNALIWIHPGIYRARDGMIEALVSNFNNTDYALPAGSFTGYVRRISPVETHTYEAINSLPTERRIDRLKQADRASWEQFIVKELDLKNNKLLQANPRQLKEIIDAFMHNLNAVAKHSHDFGNTDLLQFHLQIKPGSKPVRDKCRPLNPIQSKDFERQLKEWTEEGVIEPY